MELLFQEYHKFQYFQKGYYLSSTTKILSSFGISVSFFVSSLFQNMKKNFHCCTYFSLNAPAKNSDHKLTLMCQIVGIVMMTNLWHIIQN